MVKATEAKCLIAQPVATDPEGLLGEEAARISLALEKIRLLKLNYEVRLHLGESKTLTDSAHIAAALRS